jgi:hypothetical protein
VLYVLLLPRDSHDNKKTKRLFAMKSQCVFSQAPLPFILRGFNDALFACRMYAHGYWTQELSTLQTIHGRRLVDDLIFFASKARRILLTA